VIDYFESYTERIHLHVDARHLLVGHVGPVLWMCMMWALCRTCTVYSGCTFYVDVCRTTTLVLHAMWMYVGLFALVVHAMWMYVGLWHWLYILYGYICY